MNKRIAVIIPAYNEEQSITHVVRNVNGLSGFAYHAIVVNDNSKDNTSEKASRAGATVIDLPCRLGIGGAVQTGFKYAVQNNYDACVQVDGDGQHQVSDIPKLVKPIFQDGCDLVIGSRFVSGKDVATTFMRSLGIKIISLFLRVTTRMHIKDTTSGFRAVSRRALKLFSSEYPQDYPEPESLVYAHKEGLKVIEIPTRMANRRYGQSSITPFLAGYYMVKVLLAMFIDLFKDHGRLVSRCKYNCG